MNFQKRKRRIIGILAEQGEVEVKDLALALGTSDITVRRDLNRLADEGQLERTFGGALPLEAKPAFDFNKKTTTHTKAKEAIGQLAAAQAQDGDVIFMDCGSTVYQMCPHLREKTLTVITNSLPVVNALLNTRIKINLVGGELDPQRQAIHGSMAEEHIRRYKADRAFVGVDGLSVEHGLSAVSEQEAGITLAMTRQARRVYLLCDDSKLEKNKYLSFAPLNIINTLITNAPGKQTAVYEKKEIDVLTTMPTRNKR